MNLPIIDTTTIRAGRREWTGLASILTAFPMLIAGPIATAAASMSETSNQLGIALGVALIGSFGTLVYRLHLSSRLPAELSAAQKTASPVSRLFVSPF